jgi:hypothetical protein
MVVFRTRKECNTGGRYKKIYIPALLVCICIYLFGINPIILRYTLFYEHTKTGAPPMRPLWSEFPDDEATYDEERQWMVGSALIVRPVFEPDIQQVSLYLPGKTQTWLIYYILDK